MISLREAAIFILVCSLFSAGCTWVKVTPEGEQVVLLPDSALIPPSCERLGQTRSHTRARLGLFKRDQEKIATEQATLARNEAARMGGNAIVSLDSSEDGDRLFSIYRCDPTP